MPRGSDILARPGSQPCRKRRNPSSLRGHSSTPSSKGYHLPLPASMIVPKTQWAKPASDGEQVTTDSGRESTGESPETRVVVLDNLRDGVLRPDTYDPIVNPLYRDMLQHYNVVALPCCVRDPDRKGKVERGVGHAKNTPLKGLRFESLEEAQTYLDHWEARWADTRIHGATKRQVAVMFAEEKPTLLPLPVELFRHYQYGERTVHLDGCVEVEAAYYRSVRLRGGIK